MHCLKKRSPKCGNSLILMILSLSSPFFGKCEKFLILNLLWSMKFEWGTEVHHFANKRFPQTTSNTSLCWVFTNDDDNYSWKSTVKANYILFHTPQRSKAYRAWGAYYKTEQCDYNIYLNILYILKWWLEYDVDYFTQNEESWIRNFHWIWFFGCLSFQPLFGLCSAKHGLCLRLRQSVAQVLMFMWFSNAISFVQYKYSSTKSFVCSLHKPNWWASDKMRIWRVIEGEGEVAFFSAKRWDRRNRADLIESATPCHDALPGGALPGLEPTPPDYSGCNVRGLHHGATTPSTTCN